MPFVRLTRLGKEKFQRVVNELMRGTPPPVVARLIHEWGNETSVREGTLAKQLRRLQTAVLDGAFGGDVAEEARREEIVRIKQLHDSTLDCLAALTEAFWIQRERVLDLRARTSVAIQMQPGSSVGRCGRPRQSVGASGARG